MINKIEDSSQDLALAREAFVGIPHLPRGRRGARPSINGYDPICIHHQGGQGVVYIARQKSTGRNVAIKLLRSGRVSTPLEQARFEREVKALGQLEHPHIVTIHDSGSTDGIPFIVMDYVDGTHLDSFVEMERPEPTALLQLFETIAQAVEAAHRRGVIHRDLKPANILIVNHDEPVIVDFGLAKLHGPGSSSQPLTLTGGFVGTLPWSSTEQARGELDLIDTRTDVYALGLTFWYTWTGSFPYAVRGNNADVLEQITQAAPSRPSQSRYPLSRDLEIVLRKCLSKDRDRRYGSAGELAADLHNIIEGKPIAARRDSATYVLGKWVSRHRVLSAMTMLLLFLILASSVVFQALYRNADHYKLLAQRTSYRASLSAAHAAIILRDAVAAKDALALSPVELRGWEWRHLSARADESIMTIGGYEDTVSSVAWSPDGRRIASGCFDTSVRVTSFPENREIHVLLGNTDLVFDVDFSPDGGLIASGGRDRTVRLWDSDTGEPLQTFNAPERVVDIEFSPDGERIACAASFSQLAVIWNIESGEEELRLPRHERRVESIAFNRDGSLIAIGSFENGIGQGNASVRIHDSFSGALVNKVATDSLGVREIEFAPDDDRLLISAGGANGFVSDWRREGESRVEFAEIGPQRKVMEFADRGKRVVAGGVDGLVHVADAFSGATMRTMIGHLGRINQMDVDPTGRFAASASYDRTVKVWDMQRISAKQVFRAHDHGIGNLLFAPDGRWLLSGSADMTAGVWDTSSWQLIERLTAHKGNVQGLAVTHHGDRVFTGNLDPDTSPLDGAIYEWDPDWVPRLVADELPSIGALAVSHDDSTLFAAVWGQELRAWDVDTLEERLDLANRPVARTLAASPADSLLAVTEETDLIVLDTNSGERLHQIPIPGAGGRHLPTWGRFSPNGSWFAISTTRGVTTIWDTATWEAAVTIPSASGSWSGMMAFDPTGTRLALCRDTGLELYEVPTFALLMTFREITEPHGATFSPNGKQLVASSSDRTIHVWTVPAGEEE